MIYLITGGERSGKSSYAQNLALQLSDAPIYVATARKWDADFKTELTDINRNVTNTGLILKRKNI